LGGGDRGGTQVRGVQVVFDEGDDPQVEGVRSGGFFRSRWWASTAVVRSTAMVSRRSASRSVQRVRPSAREARKVARTRPIPSVPGSDTAHRLAHLNRIYAEVCAPYPYPNKQLWHPGPSDTSNLTLTNVFTGRCLGEDHARPGTNHGDVIGIDCLVAAEIETARGQWSWRTVPR
jgi:hypothetical protein